MFLGFVLVNLCSFFFFFWFYRFDECGISPWTVKALSAAGYFQMTRVQEATLSVCLEGVLSHFGCCVICIIFIELTVLFHESFTSLLCFSVLHLL